MNTKVYNPFLNTAAQVVECVHCLEEAIKILEEFKEKGTDQSEKIVVGLNEKGAIPVKSWEKGVGAVEVPRGTLFHCYETDDAGTIVNADCVIPTSQNVNNIEQDMRKLVPGILDKTDDEITLMMGDAGTGVRPLHILLRAFSGCEIC